MLLDGIARGDYTITTESIFELTNIASLGSCDRENIFFNLAMAPLSVVANYYMNYVNHSEMGKLKPHSD